MQVLAHTLADSSSESSSAPNFHNNASVNSDRVRWDPAGAIYNQYLLCDRKHQNLSVVGWRNVDTMLWLIF